MGLTFLLGRDTTHHRQGNEEHDVGEQWPVDGREDEPFEQRQGKGRENRTAEAGKRANKHKHKYFMGHGNTHSRIDIVQI